MGQSATAARSRSPTYELAFGSTSTEELVIESTSTEAILSTSSDTFRQTPNASATLINRHCDNRHAISPLLKVIVGPKNKRNKVSQTFLVHKEKICELSEFFKAACNERWESGKTSTVVLEENDPTIFSIFLTWVESGDIEKAPSLHRDPASQKEEVDLDEDYIQQLLKSYFLGDFLQAEGFQHSVMDLLVVRCHRSMENPYLCSPPGLGPSSINYIMSNSQRDDPIRRMIFDYWSQVVDVDNKMEDDIPKEFYHELSTWMMFAFRCGPPLVAPWNKYNCAYHLHRSQPEYSCTQPW